MEEPKPPKSIHQPSQMRDFNLYFYALFHFAMYTNKIAFTTPIIQPANPNAPWKSSMYNFQSPAASPLIPIIKRFTKPMTNQFGPSVMCIPHPSFIGPKKRKMDGSDFFGRRGSQAEEESGAVQLRECRKISEGIGGSSSRGHGEYVYRFEVTSPGGGMDRGPCKIPTLRESCNVNCDPR
jgi:hypothetical protein